ncbi:hypothetical protein N5J07_07600 [Comamonas aquatica]|uniref:hypothetical protein n=1 Tax=Comamonas aquatica TaxID=225991 RepID=UPI00244C7AD7|nr:hypothetical protein [Comamonas aquatica]MDH1379321.1 hypothetical protein [Comamonas aquatica]MDH1639191.1 hypothetical protein [Comamonas aquatica]
MEKDEPFQVDNLHGDYVQKTIADCIKDFENELEKTGLRFNLINKERSIEILSAYINSEQYFSELIKGEKESLHKLLPHLSAAYINNLSIGVLKAIIIKFHHNLFRKEIAIELAKDVFFLSIICMEKRTGFDYLEDEINKSFAIKGANARHKENRDSKADVFEWLDKHMHEYKSMDDAAFAIAEKVVPMKFRTVRQWLTEWKKLRSAGTT